MPQDDLEEAMHVLLSPLEDDEEDYYDEDYRAAFYCEYIWCFCRM